MRNTQNDLNLIAATLIVPLFGDIRCDDFHLQWQGIVDEVSSNIHANEIISAVIDGDWSYETELSSKGEIFNLTTESLYFKLSKFNSHEPHIYSLLITKNPSILILSAEDSLVAEAMFRYLKTRYASE